MYALSHSVKYRSIDPIDVSIWTGSRSEVNRGQGDAAPITACSIRLDSQREVDRDAPNHISACSSPWHADRCCLESGGKPIRVAVIARFPPTSHSTETLFVTPSTEPISRRFLWGLLLISFALIQYEIALTRVFSAKLGYHFSFMAVSLALYGLGSSGLWIYLRSQHYPRRKLGYQTYRGSMAFGISIPIVAFLLLNLPVDLSFSPKGLLVLTFIYLTSAVPFYFGGLVVSLLLTHGAAQSGRIYGYDLAGAAAGCVFLIPLLDWLGAPTALLCIAGTGALAAYLFADPAADAPSADDGDSDDNVDRSNIGHASRRRARVIALGLALLGLLIIVASRFLLPLLRSVGRSLFEDSPRYKHLPRGFDYYFDQYVAPAIAPILDWAWIPGVLVIVSAGWLVWRWRSDSEEALVAVAQRRYPRRAIVLMVVCAVLCIYSAQTGLMRVWYAKGDFQFNVVHEQWNSFSRVSVQPLMAEERSAVHGDQIAAFNWGLSRKYKGDFPEQYVLNIDSDAGTPIQGFSGNLDEMAFLRWDVTAFAYNVMKPRGTALVIGPGGGRDVLTALVAGSAHVNAVEINPLIVAMLRDQMAEFSGHLYARDDVTIHVRDGRSFIDGTEQKFDSIQVSLIDTWAATAAGAYALSENSLYTIEAFDSYLDHLQPGGVLSFSRWLLRPPKQSLRTLALMVEALERAGIEQPSQHVAVVKNEMIATLFLKTSPFTDEDFRVMEADVAEKGFEWILHPKKRLDNVFNDLAFSRDREAFYDDYPFLVRPPTDDRPFFFHMLKPDRLGEYWRLGQSQIQNFQAILVLFALLMITLVLSGVFYLVPVWLLKRQEWLAFSGPKRTALLYYGLLGLGFMMIEIPFLQRFSLFLGHPTYSLTVVLFTILLFSGIGSLLSQKIIRDDTPRRLTYILLTLVAVALLENWFIDVLFAHFQTVATAWKVLLTIIGLAPLGFLLGMPFPTGLRFCSRPWPAMVPWAWAVNGTTSVLGTVIAMLAAMFLGFRASLYLGAFLYLLAAGAALRWLAYATSNND